MKIERQKKKIQKAKEKKVRAEERAEEHKVMWPTKRCIEVGVKLHEAIRTNKPLARGHTGPHVVVQCIYY